MLLTITLTFGENGQQKFYQTFSKVTGRWTAKTLDEKKIIHVHSD